MQLNNFVISLRDDLAVLEGSRQPCSLTVTNTDRRRQRNTRTYHRYEAHFVVEQFSCFYPILVPINFVERFFFPSFFPFVKHFLLITISFSHHRTVSARIFSYVFLLLNPSVDNDNFYI